MLYIATAKYICDSMIRTFSKRDLFNNLFERYVNIADDIEECLFFSSVFSIFSFFFVHSLISPSQDAGKQKKNTGE